MADAVAARPWRRALAWLALLGPFFFLTYGWANELAASRTQVPSIVFGWEAQIPFLAWTILPYWSIDAFYALSLLVCLTRHELDRHALRLLSAQVIAVTCFVLWPLRFSFEKPETHGLWGAMFDALGAFDKPFNQAPSLHIVLLVLLWLRFGAHTRSPWRWVLHVWAVLIGLSVLTTYQHHFIDIPTGMLAGFLVAWLWPMRLPPPWRTAQLARSARRWALALAYGVAATLCGVLGCTVGGAALWLLWPAVSLALVALNYAWLGAGGFQKEADGGMSLAVRWLYAPYLAAAWLNSRLWTRRAPQPVEIAEGVWLGRMPDARTRDAFPALVDLCAELPSPPRAGTRVLPLLDLVPPDAADLRAAAEAIEAQRQQHGRVLVCCALGYSRSAAAVAAWLLHSGRAADVAAALATVRAAHPRVVLQAAHHSALASLRPLAAGA
jgi:membrane-associated phospholipid phosphatase